MIDYMFEGIDVVEKFCKTYLGFNWAHLILVRYNKLFYRWYDIDSSTTKEKNEKN